ncbi:MAG: GvpL/GvpF family gas vesicle protein [Elusimicrobia bacterium]|nr:GvpL/GvpF family gas vesicle protein [Elusimicrobiota bacterium]
MIIIKEGQYAYCIIGDRQERNFGPIGINGGEVLTIGYDDLTMVVSNHPLTKIKATGENMLAHARVIEEVMKEFDSALPIRFGTIAASADEIRNLLDRRRGEFKIALRDLDHKVELGVKGTWVDMGVIFKEIVKGNADIREMKEKLQNDATVKNIPKKGEAGKLVEAALQKKKTNEAEEIVERLRRTSVSYKLNKTSGDNMFINAAFLVDKGREKEFDNIMSDLSEEYKNRIKFAYAGPLPAFNFVNIIIYPEEWEK